MKNKLGVMIVASYSFTLGADEASPFDKTDARPTNTKPINTKNIPVSTSKEMKLTPQEIDKLKLCNAGQVAQKRLARGQRLVRNNTHVLITH